MVEAPIISTAGRAGQRLNSYRPAMWNATGKCTASSTATWETELRAFLIDSSVAVLDRAELDTFTRALWSVGDLVDKQHPPKALVDDITSRMLDIGQHPKIRVAAIRALGLVPRSGLRRHLARSSDTRRGSPYTLTHSEQPMLRWAIERHTSPFPGV